MSNTLVIHPDSTTNYFKLIYEDKDYDVIDNYDISNLDLLKAIEKHDKIIIIGHGNGLGLFNLKYGGLMINDSHANFLKLKEVISIWPSSNNFFRRHNIKGLHTGELILSPLEEFNVLGYMPLDSNEFFDNMERLAIIFSECIESSPEWIKKYVINNYNDEDEVSEINRESIIVI